MVHTTFSFCWCTAVLVAVADLASNIQILYEIYEYVVEVRDTKGLFSVLFVLNYHSFLFHDISMVTFFALRDYFKMQIDISTD